MTDKIISPMASVSHISLLQRQYGPRVHMDENAASAPAAIEPAAVVSAPNLDSGDGITAEQAFEAYQKRNSPAASADTATAGTESVQADAAPEGTTVEDHGIDPENPAIDPPKSWSKDAHERWSKLDRETQEFLAARDSEDQKAIKRSLQEAADERKAAKAEREAAGQDKKAYQEKLPTLLQTLYEQQSHMFPDIRNIGDYERMAIEADRVAEIDPFTSLRLQARLKAFDAHQQKLVSVKHEVDQAEGEKASAVQGELNAYKNEQDKDFLEFAPELRDPKRKAEVTEKAIKILVDDVGFKMDDLSKWADNPAVARLLFSSGFQKLVYNNLKLSELRAAPAKAIPATVPAVQKPGVARAPGAANADAIQATRNKLNGTGSVEDAFALYQAKKARAR